jgi:O-antigen/teichoic acid export membrane protein
MALKRRLVGAFGATILGPVVTTFVQLINVPIMLRYWGVHLYGEWLVISAIPAYLLLTDLGFGNVAGSDMTIRVHAGDREGANETFQSIWAPVLLASLLIGLFLSALIFFLPVHRILHLSAMSPLETKTTLTLLSINVLVILQWSTIGAAYRCAGRLALCMLIVNTIRILESVSFLVLLVWHAGPVELAMLMLGVSVIGTVCLLLMQARLIPWISFGIRHAKWRRVRELWQPAIAYMAFPAGSAISVQGMTMMVGLVLGPVAVAVFNPMRTLSRPVFQLADAVKNSVWQELSATYGQQNWTLARKLHRSAFQVSLLLSLGAAVTLAISGPRIFALWTHGRILMDTATFYVLLIVVLFNSLWNTSSAVPMAANRHQRLALVYLASTSVSLIVAYPLIRHFGLTGAATALALCEIAMAMYVVPMSNKLLSDHWPAFAASMFDFTQLKALRRRAIRAPLKNTAPEISEL